MSWCPSDYYAQMDARCDLPHDSPDLIVDDCTPETPPPTPTFNDGAYCLPKSVVASYLTYSGLMKIVGEHETIVQYQGWRYMTHLVFFGLELHENRARVTMYDTVWIPILQEVQRYFPHLKILLAVPQYMYTDTQCYDKPEFWSSMRMMGALFNGVMLSIETSPQLPETFCRSLRDLHLHTEVWLVINNQKNVYPDTFIISVQMNCAHIVINSFGYFRRTIADPPLPSERIGSRIMMTRIKPDMESAMSVCYSISINLLILTGFHGYIQ